MDLIAKKIISSKEIVVLAGLNRVSVYVGMIAVSLCSCGVHRDQTAEPHESAYFHSIGDTGYISGSSTTSLTDSGYVGEGTNTESTVTTISTIHTTEPISAAVTSDSTTTASITADTSTIPEAHTTVSATSRCRNESFRIQLNSVCSHNPNKFSTTLEKLNQPIVAIEARIASQELLQNPRSRYPSYQSRNANVSYLQEQQRISSRLHTIDLTAEDIMEPHFRNSIEIDYSLLDFSKINRVNPAGWNKPIVTIYVCNDTNRDGRCSDEDINEQVALHSPTHQACHLPAAIAVNVHSCQP